MNLLPETSEDAHMASLLRLIPTSEPEEKRSKIETESIFSPSTSGAGSKPGFGGKLKSLQQTLRSKNETSSSTFGGTPAASSFSSPGSSSSSGSSEKSLSSKSLKIGVQRKKQR